MGTNTLQTKTDVVDVIYAADQNQYKTALGVELVPRDVSGAPSDSTESAGTSTFSWLLGYFVDLIIGVIASGLKIVESTGTISMQVGSVEKFKIDSGGVDGSYLKAATVPDRALGQTIETSATRSATVINGPAGIDSSWHDITDFSFTITTTGRPVLLQVRGAGGVDSVQEAIDTDVSGALNGIASGGLAFLRDGVLIASQLPGVTFSNEETCEYRIPLSAFSHIDQPAAGTYTYKVQIKLNVAFNKQFKVTNGKFVVLER